MKKKTSIFTTFFLFVVLVLTLLLVKQNGLLTFKSKAALNDGGVKPMLFIGDSVGTGFKTEVLNILASDFPVAKFDAVVCRAAGYTSKCLGKKISSGLTVVNESSGQELAVIELGYNDYPHTFDKTIDKMMTALVAKGSERVLWINISERRKDYLDYPTTNKKLNEAKSRWPQLIVLDWKSASDGSDKNDWFADGIHLKTKGSTKFANWFRSEMVRLRTEGKLPTFGSGNVPSVSPTQGGPSPTSSQQLTPTTVDYGQLLNGVPKCANTFGSGASCMSTASCTGTVKTGYCPGPSTWKCCVVSDPTTVTPTNTLTPIPTSTGTAMPTPTETSTSGETGDVELKFAVSLQGVTDQPVGDQTVPFKVKLKGSTNTDYKTGKLTADNDGTWTGSVAFSNIPTGPGTKYTIFVKAGKHIQKRICSFAPSGSKGGTYNCSDSAIPLSKGVNNLDFSGILLLVGDLPSSSGVQNGVIDSYDISYVLNHLGSQEEDQLAIGDLNFDGVIDTQDRSLIIQSLNIKYDDE